MVTGNQSMVVVTLGGRDEGNIKSYTYMRHILVPPRHLCRLIPAWHPMVPVASREHFILAGLLCCNGNHNTSLRATLQSSAVEDLAAKMGRDGAAACAGIRGSRARKRRRLPGARGADQRIRALWISPGRRSLPSRIWTTRAGDGRASEYLGRLPCGRRIRQRSRAYRYLGRAHKRNTRRGSK